MKLPLTAPQLEALHSLVTACGQEAWRLSQTSFKVFEKGQDDYVTSVDRLLDQKLLEGFSSLFPADGIITEENLKSRQAFQASCDRFWLIDPIDGTEDFIHRRDYYAVMIGLLQDHTPQAGWIFAPALSRLYYGGSGWGLFSSHPGGEPQELIPQRPLTQAAANTILLGDKDQRRFGAAIAHHIPDSHFHSLGSFGLKVMEVILGRAALYVYLNGRVKLWDTTGPLALAIAAGLTCCDLEGEPIQFGPQAVHMDTLIHRQAIVIGWPENVALYRPRIKQAVADVLSTDVTAATAGH